MASNELNVYLTRGLEGRGDQIDLLAHFFEQSQTLTVETANPMLDLISFALDCTEFWIINVNEGTPIPVQAPLETWPQEEFTNSLENPLGEHNAPVDIEHEQPSSHLDTMIAPQPTPTGNNATPQCGPTPPDLPPSALYDEYPPTPDKNVAGFVYLLPSSAYPDALHFQEYNIGIFLRPEWRNRGVAARALHSALDHVFSQPNVHRIQAQVIDCYKNVQALTLFTRMGFSHEGMRRQGFHCPLTAEWKDVTTLAILVTDWYIHVRDRNGFQSAPKSLWDALFTRHQQEREELLRWEDRRPHRSSSLETIRDGAATPVPLSSRGPDTSDSEAGTASESESFAVERPKRKLFEIVGNGNASNAYDASSSEYESEYESAVGGPSKRIRSRSGGPNSAGASASSLAIDGPSTNLDSLLGKMRALASQMGEGPSASISGSPVSPRALLHPAPEEVVPALSYDQSRNPSPSPGPSVGSVATTPPSENESEFELEDGGYVTSSSTDSSPSGWEIVDSDDESG